MAKGSEDANSARRIIALAQMKVTRANGQAISPKCDGKSPKRPVINPPSITTGTRGGTKIFTINETREINPDM